jgi:ribosomal protein S18 acetylase RimI-like enzyme
VELVEQLIERLSGAPEVLAATDGDLFARNTVRPDAYPTTGWRRGDAVAWVGFDAEERRPHVQVLGPAAALPVLLDAAVPELPAELLPEVPLTLPADAAGGFGERLRVDFHWRFRVMTAPPEPVADLGVRVLPGAGDERVARLLARSTELTSAVPGDAGVRRWAVVEEGGDVLACAADTSGAPGVGHMGGVAVAPEARRRGLGAAVVAWLTRDLLLAGCDAVAVGVLVREAGAQRLYDRVGYRTLHELRSGVLRPPG